MPCPDVFPVPTMTRSHPAPTSAFRLPTVALVAAASLAAAGLPGCHNGSKAERHQQWVKDGQTRWHNLRSNVILETAQRDFDAGKLDQAEKKISEAASVDTTNPRLFNLAGRIYLERGELEKAFSTFSHAIVLDDNAVAPMSEPYYFQGVILQRWQRHD